MIVEEKSHRGGTQVLHRFDNGYGASVIQGPYSYGGDEGLFEIGVIEWEGESYGLTYNTPITGDVLGYVKPEDVQHYLDEIEALSKDGVKKHYQMTKLHELAESIKSFYGDEDLHPEVRKYVVSEVNGAIVKGSKSV